MGVHPKIVQEMLGHSSISVTLDTYSHVLPTLQRDAVSQLNQVLGVFPQPVAVSVAVNVKEAATDPVLPNRLSQPQKRNEVNALSPFDQAPAPYIAEIRVQR